jgi:hypothetical protein
MRYDFGSKDPVVIESPQQLKALDVQHSTFASIKGTINFKRAATFATHGLKYTYFMLDEYDNMLIVRTYETIDESWAEIGQHVGRLKPYDQMPFSRSVRAGFKKNFDVMLADKAYFLGRDDVPGVSGWSVGATIFAVALWCILAYFFFIRKGGLRPIQVKPRINHEEQEGHEDKL